MFSNNATSRGVTRIALGSSGRSNNFLRSRTIVSMHSIITCPYRFSLAVVRMDALVAAGAPLSRVSIAGGDGQRSALPALDRVRLPPLFAHHANDAPLYAFPFSS